MARLMPEYKTPFGTWSECREVVTGVWRLRIGDKVAYWVSEPASGLIDRNVRLEFLSFGEDVYAQDGWYAPGIPAAFLVTWLCVRPDAAKAFPAADREAAESVVSKHCRDAARRNNLIS